MAICMKIFMRQISTSCSMANVFNHVTVIGGGLMGSGIAQVTAQSGMDVTIIEVNEEAAQRSDANIKNNMQRVAKKLFQNSTLDAEKYLSETMGRLKISTDLNEVIGKTDLVVEAIVENLSAKHRLFSRIDTIAPEHTIFTSNTSSIPITEIASVTLRKDRFGGLHFFNPVPVMKLLEVVRTDDTSEETYQKLLAWGKAVGKTCITCKDTPGFVVNRLLIPYLAEAIRMLESGIASAKDIDIAMKLGAGYPMGPLELLDYVGLDTTKFILDGWHEKYPNNPLFNPIDLLQKLVQEGKLGKKTGEGFYSYKKTPGTYSIPIHCPYLQPITYSPVNLFPFEQSAKETPKASPSKEVKTAEEKAEFPEYDFIRKPKMVKPEKWRKVAQKLSSINQWKNSEEFLSEREKQAVGSRKTSFLPKQTPKQILRANPRPSSKQPKKHQVLEDIFRLPRNHHIKPRQAFNYKWSKGGVSAFPS